jgi:prevent-host-death family protein
MKRASITEAKNNLSALIDGLKGSGPVLIVDRGRPVARLEPLGEAPGQASERLANLVRAGLVRPGKGPIPLRLIREPPAKPKDGASAVAALLAERREGR